MKPYVSSYAASGPGLPFDREAEAALFDALARMDLAGLELPFYDSLHPHDDAWLIDRLRPEWRFVVTPLPGIMNRLKDDRHFGLASADADGRKRALEFSERVRRTVEHLCRYLGRPAVSAVNIHSAPRLGGSGARSSLEAFVDSLTQMRSWDWSGAELLVEHCDAAVPEHAPDKGFLRLEDECAAIRNSRGRTPLRVLVNWGRSAIEARSAEGPIEHLRRAKEAGMLAALFFSGATPDDPDYGPWKDFHMPFSSTRPASLMTVDAARRSLREAGELDYVGIKIMPMPVSLGAAERIEVVRQSLEALRSAMGAAA